MFAFLFGVTMITYVYSIKNEKEKERMKNSRKQISVCLVFLIVFCFSVSSAWAEADSPAKVAKEFTKAYFKLDPSMASYLSSDARVNRYEMDMVDLFFDIKEAEAHNKGYELSYMKMMPVQVKTEMLKSDDTTAEILVNATTIRAINPLYRAVGFVFGMLDEHETQDVITLVKEDGEWKIGPGAFDLPIPL